MAPSFPNHWKTCGPSWTARSSAPIWSSRPLRSSRLAGITRIVLPFVDASRIHTPQQEDAVVAMLAEVLPQAAGVELHLETAYGPSEFAAMLARLPHPLLKANYDSGNSSSLGYLVT